MFVLEKRKLPCFNIYDRSSQTVAEVYDPAPCLIRPDLPFAEDYEQGDFQKRSSRVLPFLVRGCVLLQRLSDCAAGTLDQIGGISIDDECCVSRK